LHHEVFGGERGTDMAGRLTNGAIAGDEEFGGGGGAGGDGHVFLAVGTEHDYFLMLREGWTLLRVGGLWITLRSFCGRWKLRGVRHR